MANCTECGVMVWGRHDPGCPFYQCVDVTNESERLQKLERLRVVVSVLRDCDKVSSAYADGKCSRKTFMDSVPKAIACNVEIDKLLEELGVTG